MNKILGEKMFKKKIIVLIVSVFVVSSCLFSTPQDSSWWNKSSHNGTRKDAIQIREFFDWKISQLTNQFDIRMGISGIVRGNEAYQYLKQYSQYNDEPDEGKEYLMAYVYLDVLKEYSGVDSPLTLNSYLFNLYNDKWSTINDADVLFVSCSDSLKGDVYEDGQIEGFVIFQVPIKEQVYMKLGKTWYDLGISSKDTDKL
jgi:hypothetical protein